MNLLFSCKIYLDEQTYNNYELLLVVCFVEETRFMLSSRLDYHNTSTLQHSIVTLHAYSTLTHQPKVIQVYLGVYELDTLHVVTETPSMSLLGTELGGDS